MLASFPGPRPASCRLQYGKAGEGRVHFLTWVTSWVGQIMRMWASCKPQKLCPHTCTGAWLLRVERWSTFDIVLFCGFSLRNEVRPQTSILAGSLLVFLLSRTVVIRASNGSEHHSEQLFQWRPPASDIIDRTVWAQELVVYKCRAPTLRPSSHRSFAITGPFPLRSHTAHRVARVSFLASQPEPIWPLNLLSLARLKEITIYCLGRELHCNVPHTTLHVHHCITS